MTTHEQWCAAQRGCISPGAKPCTMCKRAYEAALESVGADKVNKKRVVKMTIDKQTIKMTIKRIVKRQQGIGPELYLVYAAVPSIHPKKKTVEMPSVKGPLFCCTSEHFVPTEGGLKQIEQVKAGDVVLMSLDLICM